MNKAKPSETLTATLTDPPKDDKDKKKRKSQAEKLRSIAHDAANQLQRFYLVGNSGDSYEPTLLAFTKDNTVRVATRHELVRDLIDGYSMWVTESQIRQNLVTSVINRLADHRTIQLTDIRPFMFKTEKALGTYCWHRLSFDPDIDAPEVPEYEQMRARCQDAFDAQTQFFGSILDYDFLSEQYLHISGEGNDGKSSLMQAIRNALPPGFATAIQASDLEATHGLAKIEGRRLLVFSEENSAGFMSGGRFKQLTGRDPISINPKNQPERECVPNCRVIVTSNSKPTISGKSADARRIIPVFYEKFADGVTSDQGWSSRLKAKGPAILQFCHAQFMRHIKNEGAQRIAPPAETVADLSSMSTESAVEAELVRLFDPADNEADWSTPGEAAAHIRRNVKDRILQAQLREHLLKLIWRPKDEVGKALARKIKGLKVRRNLIAELT